MNNFIDHLSSNLMALRKANGLTRNDFAKSLSISVSQLYRMETAKNQAIPIAVIQRLKEVYKVDFNSFFCGKLHLHLFTPTKDINDETSI